MTDARIKVEGHSAIVGMAARTIGTSSGKLDPTGGLDCAAVVLKAAAANSGTVYVGNENVTTAKSKRSSRLTPILPMATG